MKAICIYILLLLSNTVQSQPLILYKTEDVNRKYVLTRSYQDADGGNVSEVIIAETFSVHPSGIVCQVTMSNAYVFRTKIGTISSSHSTNGVVQNKMMFDCLRMDFRNGTKVLFNESMKDLSQVEPSKGNEGNLKIYRGQAAEQQRKKMGLGPPDETDK